MWLSLHHTLLTWSTHHLLFQAISLSQWFTLWPLQNDGAGMLYTQVCTQMKGKTPTENVAANASPGVSILETTTSKVTHGNSSCQSPTQALSGSGHIWHQESSFSSWGTLHYKVNKQYHGLTTSDWLKGLGLYSEPSSCCSDLAKPNILRFRTCYKESPCFQAPGQKYERSDWGWKGIIFCLLLSSQMGKQLIYLKGFVSTSSVHVPGVMERPIFKYWDL